MNLPLFIARRYFLSKKKTSFINIISLISMLGVGVGTMALVIVLSVFNGLEDLFRNLYGTFSSEIQVTPAKGKSFVPNPLLLENLRDIEGVQTVAEIIEDNALLTYRDGQMVVKVKGTSEELLRQNGMEEAIVQGKLALQRGNVAYALIGSGVQYTLSVALTDEFEGLQLLYPKNRKTLNPNSPDAYQRLAIRTSGVFALEQQYDNNYVFVPLAFARNLLGSGDKRTALEIKVAEGYRMEKVQQRVAEIMGSRFRVLNRDEQNESMLRAIRIEKLFVYLTFSFILAVASFNIFFSLTMLAIDKQKDIGILYALGATQRLVRRIFLLEGVIIAFTGAGTGLLLGVLICWVQQKFELVSMGMQTSVVEAYPVQMKLLDLVYIVLTLIVITSVASWFPARSAARQKSLFPTLS